jgi:hypothetical protein
MRRHGCVVGSPVRALARRVGAGMCVTLAAGLVAAASAAAAPNAWTAVGSLATARVESAVAVMPSGKVLMAGGFAGSGQILVSSEIYDPATGTWSAGADMPAGRIQASAVTLPNGDVLVAGGESDGSTTDPAPHSAVVYSPADNTFTTAPGTMSDGHALAGIALLPDGDAMVIGGFDPASGLDLSTTAIYDPSTGDFTPGPSMNDPRESPMVTTLGNGDILVAGGADFNDNRGALHTAEVFDPHTNTWSDTATAMSTTRTGGGTALLPDGRVLVTGGTAANGDVLSSTDIYDPATNAFTTGAAMAQARAGFGIAPLANGDLLVAGGLGAEPTATAAASGLTSTEIYDPTADTWSPSGDLPAGVILQAMVPLPNGEVLEAGGSADLQSVSAQAAVFDPAFAPGAPTAVTATPGDGQATVTWTAATANGAPVSGYTVTASSGQSATVAGDVTSTTVTGLTDDTPVTFTVTATNAVGTSPASTASSAVTPAAPTPPTSTTSTTTTTTSTTPTATTTTSTTPTTTTPVTTPTTPVATPPGGSRPAPDRAAALQLSGLASRMTLKQFLKGVRFTVTPSKAVTIQVTLTGAITRRVSSRFKLAGARFGLAAAARKVKLMPSRKLVGHSNSMKLQLTIVANDAAGTRSTVTRVLTIKG